MHANRSSTAAAFGFKRESPYLPFYWKRDDAAPSDFFAYAAVECLLIGVFLRQVPFQPNLT